MPLIMNQLKSSLVYCQMIEPDRMASNSKCNSLYFFPNCFESPTKISYAKEALPKLIVIVEMVHGSVPDWHSGWCFETRSIEKIFKGRSQNSLTSAQKRTWPKMQEHFTPDVLAQYRLLFVWASGRCKNPGWPVQCTGCILCMHHAIVVRAYFVIKVFGWKSNC